MTSFVGSVFFSTVSALLSLPWKREQNWMKCYSTMRANHICWTCTRFPFFKSLIYYDKDTKNKMEYHQTCLEINIIWDGVFLVLQVLLIRVDTVPLLVKGDPDMSIRISIIYAYRSWLAIGREHLWHLRYDFFMDGDNNFPKKEGSQSCSHSWVERCWINSMKLFIGVLCTSVLAKFFWMKYSLMYPFVTSDRILTSLVSLYPDG